MITKMSINIYKILYLILIPTLKNVLETLSTNLMSLKKMYIEETLCDIKSKINKNIDTKIIYLQINNIK
jgi:hypothetical protein